LRQAQRLYPGDFWVNHDLASELFQRDHSGISYRVVAADELPLLEEAIGFFRAAVALRPASPGAYVGLGIALYAKGDLAGAVTAFRQALALGPKLALAHSNLGDALKAQGDLAGAIAAFHRALALDPRFAQAHSNLGNARMAQGDVAGAIAAYRRAVELDPRLAPAHSNLGVALQAQGDLAGAIGAFRRALALDPRLAPAHCNLGDALIAQGDLAGALASFRQAIEVDPRFAPAHSKLGNALRARGDLAAALAAFRRAIALDPRYALAHSNLGDTLQAQGDVAGALAACRRAIEINPKLAPAHGALGQALLSQGRFAEARAATRRCLDLLPPNDPRRPFGTHQLRQCERLLTLDDKLPAFLKGQAKPADADERLALAHVCLYKQLYAASARFSAEAFADQPPLAEDLRAGHRYHAACAAALAGCGRGQDADRLNDKERARWRGQAQHWLRADLALHAKRLESGAPAGRAAVQLTMQRWLAGPDLAGVRGAEALARLPAEERPGWAKLWAEAEALRQQAQEETK
jgi:tetratricopeptide (TPR) repeat protein